MLRGAWCGVWRVCGVCAPLLRRRPTRFASALKTLIHSTLLETKSANFADFVFSISLTHSHLAAALLAAAALPAAAPSRPRTPFVTKNAPPRGSSGQGLISGPRPCPHFGLPRTSGGQGPPGEMRPCPIAPHACPPGPRSRPSPSRIYRSRGRGGLGEGSGTRSDKFGTQTNNTENHTLKTNKNAKVCGGNAPKATE